MTTRYGIAGLLCLAWWATGAAAQTQGLSDCTDSVCGNGRDYAIQIIGYDGDRPPGPFDTAAARENDNRVDVSGEFFVRLPTGGTLWATEDPAVMDPRIAAHTADTFPVQNGRVTAPVEFFVYKNYDAFIDRALIEIYHDRDIDRLEPLARLTLPEGNFVSVAWEGASGRKLNVGDALYYRVLAYDKEGRLDRTLEKRIVGVSPADHRAPEGPVLGRRADAPGGDRPDGPAGRALAGSPLNGKVAVMQPPTERFNTETLNYTLTPHFDTRKTFIKPADRAELDRIIADWADASDIHITAVGHTDHIRIAPEHRHEFANNQVLSEARAASVISYLANGLNVPPDNTTAIGRGKQEPVATNLTAAGRAQNRRVELTITGKRRTRAAFRQLAVELVDPASGTSVPMTGTLEEALNILTVQTGDTTPGAALTAAAVPGRRLEVDCRVAQQHGHEVHAIYGRNELETQNIPMYGSRVRLHGQDVDGNYAMQVNGRMVPIDIAGKFAVEYMMPVGAHSFDVEFMDEGCVVRDQADVAVNVSGEHMFMVGLADLTLSQSDIGGSIEPLSADDRYDDDFLAEGRLAFYLKGKIRGKYLMTAQLDTKEEELSDILDNLDEKDPRAIFRRLDPDRYYPVYGDDSTTILDTDTIGKMYVRVDWDKSHATWGNYHTGFTGTEFAQYNRSLYGAQLDWHSLTPNAQGDSRTEASVFVSENQTELGHSEFIGTGGSLYYLRHTDILPGSDKLRVEIRDRDSDRVLENITLTRGVDYEIDELQGRVILSRPLMQVSMLQTPGLVKDSPLDGNAMVLIADYEFIPAGFSPDHVGVGARGKHWFGDHLAVGGTYVSENRGGGADDYQLAGVDVTLQAAPNTFLKAEFASSEENQVERFLSNDGGLQFDSMAGAAGRDGDAFAIEGRVNTREVFGSENEWVAAAWYRHSDEGFSIARRDAGVDVDEYGAELVGQVGERITVAGRAAFVERDTERDHKRYSLQVDYRLSDRDVIAGELRHVDEETNVFTGGQVNQLNRTEQGDGTIAALRYTRTLNDRWSVYAGGQVSIDQGDGYDNNDLGTVGAIARIGESTHLIAEYSSGHRGDGASATLDHAINERHRVYGTYTHSTDRTDPLANHQVAVGQRAMVSRQLTVFNEHQFAEYEDEHAGIAHVFGFDYALPAGWNLGASYQTGDLETGSGLVDRDAVAGTLAYRGDRLKFSSRLEFRSDEGTAVDAEQFLSANRVDYLLSVNTRLLARLNFSETDNTIDPRFDAKFTEAQIGVAYRPVYNGRLNLLAKYTYLYDLRGFDQDETNTDQRSNIWSVEGIYRLTPKWDIGGKYAYRHGELRAGRGTGDWFESTTNFFAVRGRYHLIRAWDALLEYRWLEVDEARSERNGFLVALDRHFGERLKLGIGYNFTDFSDDLTDLDYDHKGWFLNAVGKY